jgi:hypothetical protein
MGMPLAAPALDVVAGVSSQGHSAGRSQQPGPVGLTTSNLGRCSAVAETCRGEREVTQPERRLLQISRRQLRARSKEIGIHPTDCLAASSLLGHSVKPNQHAPRSRRHGDVPTGPSIRSSRGWQTGAPGRAVARAGGLATDLREAWRRHHRPNLLHAVSTDASHAEVVIVPAAARSAAGSLPWSTECAD